MYHYDATMLRVIDGDTIEAVVDVGWNIAVKVIVRLAGIDCPERNTPEGVAARDFADNFFADCNSSVILISYSTKDRYGRHLARISTEQGLDLADTLIINGHGKLWDGRGKRP